jgi:hypothetical protein
MSGNTNIINRSLQANPILGKKNTGTGVRNKMGTKHHLTLCFLTQYLNFKFQPPTVSFNTQGLNSCIWANSLKVKFILASNVETWNFASCKVVSVETYANSKIIIHLFISSVWLTRVGFNYFHLLFTFVITRVQTDKSNKEVPFLSPGAHFNCSQFAGLSIRWLILSCLC